MVGALTTAAFKAVRRRHDRMTLRGKVVLITGGGRGLGFALAQEFAKRGSALALCGRSAEHLEIAMQSLVQMGADVFIHQADVSDRKQVDIVMNKVIEYYGRVDVLVNNAGTMLVGPHEVMDVEDYKHVMEANCWSALYCAEAISRHFVSRSAGQIVNIASIGGKIAVPHMLPYSVSKFALMGLSQGLATELAPAGIRVTTVVPNLMRTGSPRNIFLKGQHKLEYAWFKIVDSLPFLSQSVAHAAKQIVDGVESGKSEIVLTHTAKLALALQAFCPDLLGSALNLANRLLPRSQDTTVKKGYESESPLSRNLLSLSSDNAARKYNQI
ncbi:SDR family NAD(P)-dependent oxidoreductase [Sphingobacterium sp. LRF_L2]|uniref:SDR family NAD(P)-dependent oxidoreductase n=1 Tax=Sphingobacterium sp. LRF_L2 TaxID=3369421 RepID=UPI003F62B666